MDFPKLSAQRRDFLSRATETYYAQLPGSSGVEYLKTRGLSGGVAQSFRLGYVRESLEGHEATVGMMAIPFLTPSGTTAMRFRRIEGDGHKYHQESGTFSPLFNVRDLHRPEEYLAVCEGELDTVVMSGLVGVPAIGLAGVGNWNKHGKVYARLLQDYGRVFVVMDPDDDGQKTAKAITKVASEPTNIILPADVNQTYLDYGRDFIRKAMGLDDSDH